jgi:predicted amidohydrolase
MTQRAASPGRVQQPLAAAAAFLVLAAPCQAEEFVIAGMGVMPKAWDKEANFKLLDRYAREAAAQGAQFVITPEGFLDGYTSNTKMRPESTPEKYLAIGEEIDGPLMQRCGALAKELKIYLAVGYAERREQTMYNSVALFDPEGALILNYSKTHAPGETFTARGDAFPVAPTAFGSVGAMICYDRRLPEVARILAVKGARLILVPAYGPDGKIESVTIMRIRAYENRAFIAFVNPTRVMFIDPSGNVLAIHEGEEDQLVLATIDLDRAGGGNMEERLPKLYRELIEARAGR